MIHAFETMPNYLFEEKWKEVSDFWQKNFDKDVTDLNAILFVIGMREVGSPKPEFTKEEKIDLMHIAVCRLLSISGIYKLVGHDAEEWPIYEQTTEIPVLELNTQERMLKEHVIKYFAEEKIFESE